jgi:ribonuclease HI
MRLYTDGGYSIPRGIGAWAYALVDGNELVKSDSGIKKDSTSNQLELQAMIEALKVAHELGQPITIYSDSQYVVKGYNIWMKNWKAQGWKRGNKPLKNQEYWKQIDKLYSKEISVKWVKGHNGNKWNEYVDSLTKV